MRLYLRSADRLPDPPPEQTDLRRVIVVGIVVWAVLGLAAILAHGPLEDHGNAWSLWTPPIGIVLGCLGLRWVRRVRTPPAPRPPQGDRVP
jgi:hypothetical protein